jgi:outer membrane murein-binding lipoprotein Lpp
MKKVLFATAAAAIVLSGCASVPAGRATSEVDTLYVARVEQAARQMGTTIVWINYPTRPAAAAQEATKK